MVSLVQNNLIVLKCRCKGMYGSRGVVKVDREKKEKSEGKKRMGRGKKWGRKG